MEAAGPPGGVRPQDMGFSCIHRPAPCPGAVAVGPGCQGCGSAAHGCPLSLPGTALCQQCAGAACHRGASTGGAAGCAARAGEGCSGGGVPREPTCCPVPGPSLRQVTPSTWTPPDTTGQGPRRPWLRRRGWAPAAPAPPWHSCHRSPHRVPSRSCCGTEPCSSAPAAPVQPVAARPWAAVVWFCGEPAGPRRVASRCCSH